MDLSWNVRDQSDNLNTGGNNDENLDDEYEGALDLEDLDNFNPNSTNNDNWLDDSFDPRS